MFIELIKKRRSIRKFKDKPVEPKKINYLIESALRSPSSRSLNPWEFIVVTNDELLKKLSMSLLCILLSIVYAENTSAMVHSHSVVISYTNKEGKLVKTTISRDADRRCLEIPFNASEYWDGSYASRDVTDVCK